MDDPTTATLELVSALSEVRAPLCATVYSSTAPWLSRGGSPAQVNATAALVEHQAHAGGASDADAARLAERIREAVGVVDGLELRLLPSLGIFATLDALTVIPMPTQPAPVVLVSDRFLVGPLLAAVRSEAPVFVLALSEGSVRLIDAASIPPRVLPVAGMPSDLESVLRLDLTGDRETLAHLRVSEDREARLLEYCRAIDAVVESALRAGTPLLVLAGTEPLTTVYRRHSRYAPIADEVIPGNHDDDRAADLAALAMPIADRARSRRARDELARFDAMPSRGRAIVDLEAVVDACRNGAVDTLLVDVDRRVPIRSQAFDSVTTIDLVDEAVRAALNTGATIIPLRQDDLPTPDPVAAILRYPTSELRRPGTGTAVR